MEQQQKQEIISTEILKRVKVAAPCAQSWEAMPGGERVRSCERCGHKVYNLSGMTAHEAAKLVRGAEGTRRLCVRYYRRADGSMMTRDCPVGVRAVRRRIARFASCTFASILLVGGALTQTGRIRAREQARLLHENEAAWRQQQPVPVQDMLNRLDPPAAPHITAPGYQELPIMGDMAVSDPVQGRIAVECPPEGVSVPDDKPFLRGVTNDIAPPAPPRADPFAPIVKDR